MWLLIEPALSDVSYVEEINVCNTTKLLSLMDLLLRPLNTRSYVLGALAGNWHMSENPNVCFLSSPRRSWRALNGVATASAVAGSTDRWSRLRPRMIRCCAASCAASRPTCSACGAARSSPRPRSCGSSGGARSPTSPTSSITSWKVRKTLSDVEAVCGCF